MRESGMHAIGAVVAVRAELMVLLDDLPAVVRIGSRIGIEVLNIQDYFLGLG